MRLPSPTTGYLENPDGTALTGNRSIGLTVYDAEVDGDEVCRAKPADIEPVSGRFQITLPEACTAAVGANPNLWVEVEVDGGLLGRTKLGAVPYAIEAGHATSAEEATHAQSADTAASSPVVTEWTAYTPTLYILFGATVPTNVHQTTGGWRREGDSIHVRVQTAFSAAAPNPGTLSWSLPQGEKVDLAKAGGAGLVGSGLEGSSGNPSILLYVAVRPEGDIFARYPSNNVTDQAPFASGAGVYINLDFIVPVQGWTTTTPP
jgi:hypothetical protein